MQKIFCTALHGKQGLKAISSLDVMQNSGVNLLDMALPASFAEVVAETAGVNPARVAAELTADETGRLIESLTGLRITAVGVGNMDEAMVTRGGVELSEVDPKRLASRKAPGLFFAGEILDVDGPTGGFNLQWAFSSGWLAGYNAASVE